MTYGYCSVCDGHGILVTFAKQAWQASPCPVCDPFVGPSIDGVVAVVAPNGGEVHIIKNGRMESVPPWLMFGEDGG